ncbi:hypothetical protein U14_05209 [Candidatus Moduliflexus flocculans]|uniref:Uncharacterized protein n=1 Tax=Candidatus Moduliflexus flocculans TaxID=1499966 RepID=A0A081BRA1_9BACT|nr:hypothetical protein U14_05209 [Candidatus Moduliflexus flocculans]
MITHSRDAPAGRLYEVYDLFERNWYNYLATTTKHTKNTKKLHIDWIEHPEQRSSKTSVSISPIR